MAEEPPGGRPPESDRGDSERARPIVTRRDFLAGAGIGVAATAVVAGGVTLATRNQAAPAPQLAQTSPGGPAVAVPPAPAPVAPAQAQPQAPQQPAPAPQQAPAPQLPRSLRRVTLDLDGSPRE